MLKTRVPWKTDHNNVAMIALPKALEHILQVYPVANGTNKTMHAVFIVIAHIGSAYSWNNIS